VPTLTRAMRGSRRCFDRCHGCAAVAVGPAVASDDEGEAPVHTGRECDRHRQRHGWPATPSADSTASQKAAGLYGCRFRRGSGGLAFDA
jgi:hypothetical protein